MDLSPTGFGVAATIACPAPSNRLAPRATAVHHANTLNPRESRNSSEHHGGRNHTGARYTTSTDATVAARLLAGFDGGVISSA